MPANLTPEYLKAEKWFREATTTDEKVLALERMLAVMPKHKGTDHLKADLRKKLSKLKEVATQKKGGKHVDIFHVPRSGAGQIVLLGTPNCGKSSIVAALTNAKVNVANFPFATTGPVPGMVTFEDVQIQLIDMPPITADLIAVVIDLSAEVQEQLETCLDFLESKSLLIDGDTTAHDAQGNVLAKEAFCICTKSDIAKPDALGTLKKSCKYPFEFVEISAQTGIGFGKLPAKFFSLLGIIRIYAKPPGKPADMTDPFTLPVGSTVMDMATAIHRQLAEKLRFARIWGTGVYDGQNTQRNHVLNDKDIIELHFN
ncbi:GTPase Obg [subsurface metagenome]